MSEFVKSYQDEIWKLFKPEIRDDRNEASLYLSGKLINEVTELWGVALKYRGEYETDRELATKNARYATLDESGDVAWYVYNLCTLYNIDPANAYIVEGDSLELTIKLTVYTGELLGMIMKREYHGKPTPDEKVQELVLKILSTFLSFLSDPEINYPLEEVLSFNLDKLHKRHGRSYNPQFYQTK